MRVRKWRVTFARGVSGWLIALVMFFPLFWMGLAAFKTEIDAITFPPLLFFHPTLENFVEMQQRVNFFKHAGNSIAVALGSTAIGIALALPAAYSMAFSSTRRTQGIVLWMLSNKFLPAAAVLVPIYLVLVWLNLLDTLTALIAVNVFGNLPIILWMIYSYFCEVPGEIIEAARIDGATPFQQLLHVLLPLVAPGIASTALIAIIFSWNESFWAINLVSVHAGTLALAVASFANPEGFFFAKLSAVSLASSAPIIVFGWLSQRQLVRGLTFGSVK